MKKDTVQMMAETIPEVERLLKNCNSDVWKRNGKNFIEFLKNISDLESVLSNGGYIPDRNNVPCKAGDRIIINSNGRKRKGYLKWNKEYLTFFFVSNSDECQWYFDEMKSLNLTFEKDRQEAS